MDGHLIQRWMKSCRLCLLDDGVKLPIFGEEGITREVAHKIQSCFPIVLYNADPLSKIICQRCLFMLDTVYSFRQKCVETNNVFTSHLMTLKTNSSSVKQYLEALEKNGLSSTTGQEPQLHSLTPPADTTPKPQQLTPVNITNDEKNKTKGQTAQLQGNNRRSPMVKNSRASNVPHARIKTEPGTSAKSPTKSVPLIISVEGNYSGGSDESEISVGNDALPKVSSIKQEHQVSPFKVAIPKRNFVKSTPWYCKFCNKYYKNKTTLYKHRKYFCPAKPLHCGKCSELTLFKTEQERIEHWSSHLRVHAFLQTDELLSCDVCSKKFANAVMLNNHLKLHQTNKPFVEILQNTPTEFDNAESAIEQAPLVPSSSKRFPQLARRRAGNLCFKPRSYCEFCDKSYSRKCKLEMHKRIYHFEQISKANPNVSQGFSSESSPNVLVPIVPQDKYRPGPLSKQKCNAQPTNTETQFLRGLLQSVKCEICYKSFNNKLGLSNHMRTHGPTFRKANTCKVCGRLFGSRKGLLNHLKARHKDEKLIPVYQCKPCNQEFNSRSELLLHTMTHEKIKKDNKKVDNNQLLICSYCNHVFTDPVELKSHMLTHKVANSNTGNTTDKPSAPAVWPCNICTKTFALRRNLSRHQKVHDTRKYSSYPCNVCNKIFLTKILLKSHLTTHSPSKTFHCQKCNKIFFKIETLLTHSCSPVASQLLHVGNEDHTKSEEEHAFEEKLSVERLSHENCEICGFTKFRFHKCSNYRRDMTITFKKRSKSKSSGKRISYKCQYCWATFASPHSHNSHIRGHVLAKRKLKLDASMYTKEQEKMDVHTDSDELNFLSTSVNSKEKTTVVNVTEVPMDPPTFIVDIPGPLDLRSLVPPSADDAAADEREPGTSEVPGATSSSVSVMTTTDLHKPEQYLNALVDENEFYQCTMCTKTFHSQQVLSIHIMSHDTSSDSMPFQCPFCVQYFIDSQAISQHILLNHPELSGVNNPSCV